MPNGNQSMNNFFPQNRETAKVDLQNLPEPANGSQSNRKCPMNAKNLKAFEQMDKMMDDLIVNDISGMCPFGFGSQQHKTPSSSKSDGHISRSNK